MKTKIQQKPAVKTQGQFAVLVLTVGRGHSVGELAPYYGTHVGAFSNLFNLPRDLAPIFNQFNIVENFFEG